MLCSVFAIFNLKKMGEGEQTPYIELFKGIS